MVNEALLRKIREWKAIAPDTQEGCGSLPNILTKPQWEEIEAVLASDLVYVPGLLRCKKCGFELVKKVLYVNAGHVGADNSPDNCPNDGSPMWRVSEREYREQLFTDMLRSRNDTLDFAARVCREFVEKMNARGRLQARAILEDCAKEIEGRKVDGPLAPCATTQSQILDALRKIASHAPKEESSIHGPRMRCRHCGYAWLITTKEPERHDADCAYVIAKEAIHG